MLFIVFGSYASFIASLYVGNNMEEAVGGLDVNNEFIPIFSSWWFVHLQILPMMIAIVVLLFYRNRNQLKGIYFHNIFVGIYMMLFNLLLLKLFQLFVNPFPYRVIYTILFMFTYIYSFRIGYYNAKEMVFGKAEKRPFLIEWSSRNVKSILTYSASVGSVLFTAKALWPGIGNMERRLIGSLLDFLPLALVLANFVIIYSISVISWILCI